MKTPIEIRPKMENDWGVKKLGSYYGCRKPMCDLQWPLNRDSRCFVLVRRWIPLLIYCVIMDSNIMGLLQTELPGPISLCRSLALQSLHSNCRASSSTYIETTHIVMTSSHTVMTSSNQQSFYDVLKSKFFSQWRPLSKLNPAHVPPRSHAD